MLHLYKTGSHFLHFCFRASKLKQGAWKSGSNDLSTVDRKSQPHNTQTELFTTAVNHSLSTYQRVLDDNMTSNETNMPQKTSARWVLFANFQYVKVLSPRFLQLLVITYRRSIFVISYAVSVSKKT